MDPVMDQAYSDARAILACLGPLALFVMDVEELASAGASLSVSKTPDSAEAGKRRLAQWATVLRDTRERVDAVMNDLGDSLNGGDAASDTVIQISAPVFEVLQKRRDGISLND